MGESLTTVVSQTFQQWVLSDDIAGRLAIEEATNYILNKVVISIECP